MVNVGGLAAALDRANRKIRDLQEEIEFLERWRHLANLDFYKLDEQILEYRRLNGLAGPKLDERFVHTDLRHLQDCKIMVAQLRKALHRCLKESESHG